MRFAEKTLLLAIPVAFLMNACSDPVEEFKHKKEIAKLSEYVGMVTYEVFLYQDSTFFIPESGLTSWSSGTFQDDGKNIRFVTKRGMLTLDSCYQYSADKSEVNSIPIGREAMFVERY